MYNKTTLQTLNRDGHQLPRKSLPVDHLRVRGSTKITECENINEHAYAQVYYYDVYNNTTLQTLSRDGHQLPTKS